MAGKSFKQGYTCKKCVEECYIANREPPLYVRKPDGFKFIGMVRCRTHGIQDAIALMEVN